VTAPLPARRLADRYLAEGRLVAGEYAGQDRLDPARPLLSTLVAEALAAAERRGEERAREPFRRLFAGGPDTTCRTTWRQATVPGGRIECVEVPLDDLRAAFAEAGDPS